MHRISDTLKHAVKLAPIRNYHIAHAAGLHPSTLSRIICGIERIKKQDRRVIAIGKVVGIRADDCFQKNTTEQG